VSKENDNLQTKNNKQLMEVHHHSHTSRKKWTHYLWEFLMLFLAVFCGFLAENMRERFVEEHRAKEYAKTLVEDLRKDTIELQDVIREQKIILASIDSIGFIIQHEMSGSKVPGRFYYFCNTANIAPVVSWNKATLIQLTQSGNLRYFTNTELINKISYYYVQSDYITNLAENDREKREKSIEIRNRILNYNYFTSYSSFGSINWLKIPDSMMKRQLTLENTDKKLLNEFANSLESRKRVLLLLLERVYPHVIADATDLIQILQKEYHIE
jgi:hypothetical protein